MSNLSIASGIALEIIGGPTFEQMLDSFSYAFNKHNDGHEVTFSVVYMEGPKKYQKAFLKGFVTSMKYEGPYPNAFIIELQSGNGHVELFYDAERTTGIVQDAVLIDN